MPSGEVAADVEGDPALSRQNNPSSGDQVIQDALAKAVVCCVQVIPSGDVAAIADVAFAMQNNPSSGAHTQALQYPDGSVRAVQEPTCRPA